MKAEIGSLEFLDGVIKRKQKKIANEMIERGCDAVSHSIHYVTFGSHLLLIFLFVVVMILFIVNFV